MTKLEHFKTVDQVAIHLYPKVNAEIPDHYIVIKNEKTIVNLEAVRHFTALPNIMYRKVVEILTEA